MSRLPVRVVKIGGSLFQFASLATALEYWLKSQEPAVNVLIAGGGKLADEIREWDRRFSLGDEASHWLCIEALGLSAQFLATLLPRSVRVDTLAELSQQLAADMPEAPIVFSPKHFMRVDESAADGNGLPRNWRVTSDSIAAKLAQMIAAAELVLLKSADPPHGGEWDSSYVDPHFPQISKFIPRVRMENLRHYVVAEQN